jgi:hypothetical protein
MTRFLLATDKHYMRPRIGYAVMASTVLGISACAGRSSSSITSGYDVQVAGDVSRLRAATQSYRTLDSAVAAGYPREVADCIIHAHHGAMGYHHLNRSYVDAKLDVERPEMLLYDRLPDGTYRLNGMEFIVPYRFYSRDSVPPVLFGQKLKQEDTFKYWYLHVWAWTKNADGLFADFNTSVTCPEGKGKVYTPPYEKQ